MILLSVHGGEVDHYREVCEYYWLDHSCPAERAIGLQGPGGGGFVDEDEGEGEEGEDRCPVFAVEMPHLVDYRELLRD